MPEFPRVTRAPEELGFYSSFEAARLPLPKRQKIQQMAYAPPGGNEPTFSGEIIITEYEGVATRAEAEEARDGYAKRYKSEQYGPVEDFRVDERPAWGWTETSFYKGKVDSMQLTLIVPYETMTYSIEFSARKPEWQNIEYLRSVATSFELPKKHATTAAGLIIFGVLTGALTWIWWKVKEAEASAG